MRSLLILALAASALAVPAGQRTTCVDSCHEPNIFAYQTGQRYVYQYEATTSTAILNAIEDHADVHITAKAIIDVTSPCEHTLTLEDVILEGSSHAQEFAAAITKSPLRFSFQDGRVESVCGDVSEPVWVTNFKRGVLSTFQNSMTHTGYEDIEETDISGTCMTIYKSRVEGDVVIVDKVKDIRSCSHHGDLASYLGASAYVSDSPIQNLPIFNSDNQCHQTIEAGIIKTVECHETHIFRPFSSMEGGAQTTVKTTLVLVSHDQPAVAPPSYEFIRKSPVFEKTTSTSVQAEVDMISQILADLDEVSHGEVRPEVPRLFSKLVTSLKSLDFPTLTSIYTNTKERHSHKFLVDAMPLVGTAAAVGVVKDMIINGDITGIEAEAWYTSLAFIKNPTSDMFTAIAPLLETGNKQAILGTSALINTYCKLHHNCDADAGVQQAIRAIETQLGSSCGTINEEEKTKVLVALKGLGNAGRFVGATEILQRCYTEDNDMEVRVAAIEAWRHTPCDYDRSNLLAVFQDDTKDSEIRIAAYLAVMTCPTDTVIATVKDRLTSEAVNQVGSFVWTHLSNLQESAAPEKQWIRELIGEELLNNKFSSRALKLSRNFESSIFSNVLNMGAAVESNVIFSSKSFMPRSTMLNFTLDLFGESINLFEVGGRVTGIESFLEHFFGPTGYFPQEMVEGVIKSMRQPNGDATTLEQFLDTATEDIEGSFYLRMFGSELLYNHFHGVDNLLDTSNPVEMIMELLRGGDIDYTKSLQLIDSDYSIPTMSGLPVTLSAKGTATIALRINGNINANSLTNFNIEGHFHPSAAVQMDGVMMVDAHVTRKGLKVSSTLHTSTFVDGKVHINGGKLVDVIINTPKDKVEVIDVNTKFFIMEDDILIEKDVEDKYHMEGCTPDIMGGHLCGELTFSPMSLNKPIFPLNGPFSAKVYLEKTDTQTGYVFHYAYNPQDISFLFDTPGSQVPRKVSLTFASANQGVILDINTPYVSGRGVGQYIWQNNNKHLRVEVDMENSGKYAMDIALAIGDQNSVQPTFIITSPSGTILAIRGNIGIQLGEQTSISTQVNSEYMLPDGSQQSVVFNTLVKREIAGELKTYSIVFDFTPSQYPNLGLSLHSTTKLAPNNMQTKSHLTVASVNWDLSGSLAFLNDANHKGIEAHGIIECPQKEIKIDTMYQLDAVSQIMNFKFLVSLQPGMEEGINIGFKKVAERHYEGHVFSKLRGMELAGDIVLNNSVQGQIDTQIVSSLLTSTLNVQFKSILKGTIENADAEVQLSINDQPYALKLEITRSSIIADINIIKHILLSAYVTDTGDMKKLHMSAEWDKDVDPTKALVLDGILSQEELRATLKVLQHEFIASLKKVSEGVELVGQWAPDQSIVAKIHYSLSDVKSVTLSVETPFDGWQKQDVTVSVAVNQNQLNAQAMANWKNSQQIVLTINTQLQPGLTNNAFYTNILFSSPFSNFERLTFVLDHKMAAMNINTNMEATWNDKKINGVILLTPTDNGIDGSATFTSPFTQEAAIILHHQLAQTQLSTSLEAKYGSHVSAATLNGHFITEPSYDIALHLKVPTPLEIVPEIDVNVNYVLNEAALTFVTEGQIGENKIMFNVNGQKTVSDSSTTITGDIRFITPFTVPMTVSLAHTQDAQKFTTNIEAPGSIKIHADGHYISQNDVAFNAYLTTPVAKSSITLIHKLDGTNINSAIEMQLNEERIGASVKGVLDTTNIIANLEVDIISSLRGLDDIKFNLDTKKEGNSWISTMFISKGVLSVTVDHHLTITDYFNWENIFMINKAFQMSNKMTHTDTLYTFDIESRYGDYFFHIATTADPKISAEARQFDGQVVLTSSWTDPLKVHLHYQDNGSEFKPVLNIEYKPGQVIQLASILRIQGSSIHKETTLTTPFWQPLGYKLNIDYETAKVVSLELTRGEHKTTIIASGNWEGLLKMKSNMKIISTYMPIPITVEGSYDLASPEKTVSLAVTKDRTYSITAAISGHPTNAHWRVIASFPIPNAQNILIEGEYNIAALPLTARTELTLDSKKYIADVTASPRAIEINMDVEGRKGLLATHWDIQAPKGNLDIIFQSPVDMFSDHTIHALYDVSEEMKIDIKYNNGAGELTLIARAIDPLSPHYIVNIITPIPAFTSMRAEIMSNLRNPVKTFDLNTQINNNPYTLHLEASADNLLKGHVAVKTTTAIPGWNTFGLQADLDLTSAPLKAVFFYEKEQVAHKVEGHLTIMPTSFNGEAVTTIPGWETLSFNGDITFHDQHLMGKIEFQSPAETYYIRADMRFALLPDIKVSIHTPIELIKNIEFNFKVAINEADLSADIVFKRMDDVLGAHLTIQRTQQLGLGVAILKIVTPLPGYTSIDLLGKYDFTGDVKMADIELKIEGNSHHFSAAGQIMANAVVFDIITPIEGLERVKLTGEYAISDGQFAIITTLDKAGQNYVLRFDISAVTKEFSIKLTTPIAQLATVEVSGKVEIMGQGAQSTLQAKVNDKIVKLTLRAGLTLLKSMFHASLETPVDGWNSLVFVAQYDITSAKKIVGIIVKKNDLEKVINVEAQFSLSQGYFKINTPFQGFEVLGTEYSLAAESTDPGSFVEILTLKVIQGGNDWVFTSKVQFTPDIIGFEFATPFDFMKTVSSKLVYNLSANHVEANLQLTYNQYNFVLSTAINISSVKSDIRIQVITPIPHMENIELIAKYDLPSNSDAVTTVIIAVGEYRYGFKLEGHIQDTLAYIAFDLSTPLPGWTEVKFLAKTEFTADESIVTVSLMRDGNVKVVDIMGKVIGKAIDLNFMTPFDFLPDFTFSSAFDQSRKLLEVNLVSDMAQVSIIASFNIVKVHIKTPFEIAREIVFEISQISEGSYKAEWRRNEYYAVATLERQGMGAAINVEVQSQIPGLEMISLAGKLNLETLETFLSGAINEKKVVITSSATIGPVGHVNIHIETPLEAYKTVQITFNYDLPQKVAKFEATSTSSTCHIMLELSQSQGIVGHVLMPNSERDTEINVRLGLPSGKITITSRFAPIKKFIYEYNLHLDGPIRVDSTLQLNDIELFKTEAMVNTAELKAHVEIRLPTIIIFYQQQSISSITFSIKHHGETEKQFSIDVNTRGNLPAQGSLDVVISNSFFQAPHTASAHVEYDTTQDRKFITLQVNPTESMMYKIDLNFGITPRAGDFALRITTPDRMNAPWKDISGNFNIQNFDEVHFGVTYGGIDFTLHGKVGLLESDLVFTTGSQQENILLQWHFMPNDYFLKFGPESRYSMLKLKLNVEAMRQLDMEGGFKFGSLMTEELLFTSKYNLGDGILTKDGTWTYGQYQSQHHVEVNVNVETYVATLAGTVTSNIPGLSQASFTLNINLNGKLVIQGFITSEGQEAEINVNFDNFHLLNSLNTAEIRLPFLPPRFANMKFSLSHEFRNPGVKSFIVALEHGLDEAHYININMKHSEDLHQGNCVIDVKTGLFGDAHINIEYVLSSIHQVVVKASMRTVTPSGLVYLHNMLEFNWLMGERAFDISLTLNDETIGFMTKIFASVNINNGLHLSPGLIWNDKTLSLALDVNQEAIVIELNTPFVNFENIKVMCNYNFATNSKKVTLVYERGTTKLELDVAFNIRSIKKGKINVTLTTPFEILKSLIVNAIWKKNNAELKLRVNDYECNVDTRYNIGLENSSIEIHTTIPGLEVIKAAATYNLHDFIAGNMGENDKLAGLEIEIEGHSIVLILQGHRHAEKIHLDFGLLNSFGILNDLHIMLTAEFNGQIYIGSFDVKLHEHEFKIMNELEVQGLNNFHIKSMVDTTLTSHPAIVLNIGHNGVVNELSIDYGEEKLFAVYIEGIQVDNKSGFISRIDLPHFIYEERVVCEFVYEIKAINKFLINFVVGPVNGQKNEVEFRVNPDSVTARVVSPMTGERNLRFRRSTSTDGFSAEAALDQYTIHLRGDFQDTDFKRGALLQVDVMGHKFLFDLLLQSQGLEYSEGKLIIMTPFTGFRNMGGLFTLSIQDQVIAGQAELLLPPFITPQIKVELNLDLNQKMQGQLTFDIAGEQIILKSNMAGASLVDGYSGNLELHTPIAVISDIVLDASVKMVHWSSVEVSLGINGKKVAVGLTLDANHFNTHLEMDIGAVPVKLSVDAKYPTFNNMEGSVVIVMGGQTHEISGALSIESRHYKGSVKLQTSFIERQPRLEFEIVPSENFNSIIFDVTFAAANTHQLHLDVNMASGITASARVNTPFLPEISATLILTPARAELSLQTPSGMHKLSVGWRMTARLPADCIVTVEVMSPLLPHTYKFNVLLNGDAANMMLKSELHIDDVKHTMEGKAVIGDHSAEVSLTVNTPFRNINELALTASLTLGEHSELLISATNKDKVSNIHVTFDKADRKLQVLISSPFIPKGEVSMEAVLIGSMEPNMKLKLSGKYGEKTLGAILNVKIVSINNMLVNLRLNTPFRGYKKMNFLMSFVKDDVATVRVIIDKPISLNFDLHFSLVSNKIMGDMKLDTSIPGFHLVEAKMEMPLNVFAPRVSMDVAVAGTSFGGEMLMRAKAPYELGWNVHKDHVQYGFHVRADSSFFPLLP